MRLRHVIVVWAAVSVVVACEDDKSSSGTSPSGSSVGPGTTPPAGSGGEFCQKTLGFLLGTLETCCTAEDKSAPDYAFTHGIGSALLPVCTASLEGSITKQRVTYRADQATLCYSAYQDRYGGGKCANITQTFSDPAGASCRLAFAGVGAAGAACTGDHECTEGLTCVGFTSQNDGSCKAPPAIGEDCGPARTDGGSTSVTSLQFGTHPRCAAGARCDAATRKCVKAALAGEDCTSNAACEDPLKCVLGKCAAALGGENARCRDSDDCSPELYCSAGTADEGTCLKKKNVGGTCTATPFVTECYGRCDGPSGGAGTCKSFCGSL